MHLFYIENPNQINYQSQQITVEDEEAHHAIKVLRMQLGDVVCATDGQGNWFEGKIMEARKRFLIIRIDKHTKGKGKRDYKIHIAVAPTKNIKRFEWFLEKATEIGIDEITPIISEHSERREMKVERSNKVITAAVKQSLKSYHPVLNTPIKLKDFLARVKEEEKYIAHLIDEDQQSLKQLYQESKDVCILIGPEGDFSKTEVRQAIESGFKAVRMGNERLRTETAAFVACHSIHLIND